MDSGLVTKETGFPSFYAALSQCRLFQSKASLSVSLSGLTGKTSALSVRAVADEHTCRWAAFTDQRDLRSGLTVCIMWTSLHALTFAYYIFLQYNNTS